LLDTINNILKKNERRGHGVVPVWYMIGKFHTLMKVVDYVEYGNCRLF
jgi:hypothetical protein